MSRFIATSAIRGAQDIIAEADKQLQLALKELGPDKSVAFPTTVYFLPIIYGLTGHKVEKIKDLVLPLQRAKSLVPSLPQENLWLPYLGETLDAG